MKDWTYLIITVVEELEFEYINIIIYQEKRIRRNGQEMCLTEASFSEYIGNEHKSMKVHSVLNGPTIHRKYKGNTNNEETFGKGFNLTNKF